MESNKINLVLNGIKIAIIALGIIFTAMIFAGNMGIVGSALGITYIALGLAALVAVGFGIYLFASNIKNNKGALIGIVAFVAILLISYISASSEVPAIKQVVTEGTSKMVGAGIISFYLLIIGVIGAIIFAEVRKIIK